MYLVFAAYSGVIYEGPNLGAAIAALKAHEKKGVADDFCVIYDSDGDGDVVSRYVIDSWEVV